MKRHASGSLRRLSTFAVEARAAAVVEIETATDVESIEFQAPGDLLLGGGSNILFAADVPGTVYLVRIAGRRIVQRDRDTALVEAGAGEDWHQLVLWSLEQGLSGLENLSLIPGRVGAAPIQNIGAYGVELADTLESVITWDLRERRWRHFSNTDCRFGYRDSRFKSGVPDRYLITGITLRLHGRFVPRLEYAGIREELARQGIGDPNPRQVSEAVVRLRRRKLPDPGELGNAGSFFKNPVVGRERAEALQQRFPGLPVYPLPHEAAKLGAAWMIEHCGWRGYRQGDAGVAERHALVLVNHGHASGGELLELAGRVRDSVREAFGVELEPEPRIIWPASIEAGIRWSQE